MNMISLHQRSIQPQLPLYLPQSQQMMFKDKFWLALSIDRPVSIQARTDNYGTLMRPCSRARDCENSDSTFSVFPHDFWNQGHAMDAFGEALLTSPSEFVSQLATSVRGDLCGCPRRCGSAAAGSVASRKQGKRSRRVCTIRNRHAAPPTGGAARFSFFFSPHYGVHTGIRACGALLSDLRPCADCSFFSPT